MNEEQARVIAQLLKRMEKLEQEVLSLKLKAEDTDGYTCRQNHHTWEYWDDESVTHRECTTCGIQQMAAG